MSAAVLERLVVPARIDAPEAAPFRRMVEVCNLVARDATGHSDLDEDVTDVWGFWAHGTDWQSRGFTAAVDGEIVGAGLLRHSVATRATVDADILVLPAFRDLGIEQTLLDAVETETRALGRRIVQTWTLHRPDPPRHPLVPSTGWGAIPADDPLARFLAVNGFTLEQVERNSAFDLHGPFDTVERMLADARATAGDDYRLVEWTSPTPPEWQESFAYTISRMSTDAPQGGLVVEEETWDVARVQRRDERLAAQGLMVSVAAVVHVPTGAIVAYNELTISGDPEATTQQFGTLVLREHRGHRLGALVKCANLLRWRGIAPRSPRVSTFNAEENRPMLDINEAIGFRPISYAGAWKKELH